MGLPDWRWVGRNFPRISLRSRAERWELAVSDFRAIFTAKNASPLAILGESVLGSEWAENEAFLAAIWDQYVGIPEWRSAGRNIPWFPLKSRPVHWELTVPDFRNLVEAKNATFSGDFRRPGTSVEMSPGMR